MESLMVFQYIGVSRMQIRKQDIANIQKIHLCFLPWIPNFKYINESGLLVYFIYMEP
jgi:hypothetical protein